MHLRMRVKVNFATLLSAFNLKSSQIESEFVMELKLCLVVQHAAGAITSLSTMHSCE